MICHVFLSTPSAKDAGKHSIKIHAAKYTSHANRPCIDRIAANVLEHTCIDCSTYGSEQMGLTPAESKLFAQQYIGCIKIHWMLKIINAKNAKMLKMLKINFAC